VDIRFEEAAHKAVARIDCRGGPHTLEGGGTGWFEVADTEWLHGWRLRVQASVTVPKPGYGFGKPHPVALDGQPDARLFRADDYVRVIVCGHRVDVVFPIPDCIYPFKKSGWGCSEGGPILVADCIYHCQARLQVRGPRDGSFLRRTGTCLEFVRASGGEDKVLATFQDAHPPHPIFQLLASRKKS